MNKNKLLCTSLIAATAAILSAPAQAIVVMATQDTNALINALIGGGASGIVVTGVTLIGHQQTVDFGVPGLPPTPIMSSGTYTNMSGTYGIGAGVILSTGGVEAVSFDNADVFPGYGDANNTTNSSSWAYGGTFPVVIDPANPTSGEPATVAQDALLDPITGPENHYDVTELVISFNMQPGYDHVYFNIVFGSEEYPEFVTSTFIDGLGMYLNGTNIATLDGSLVNIQHPWMVDMTGTELDGVLAPAFIPLLAFSGAVNPTGNTLHFILADTYDGVYDTVVYLSGLGGVQVSDVDADGIADGLDNCPVTANPTQLNSDGDARGNVCDNCTLTANTAAGDVPGTSPAVAKYQLDSDGDGFGNRCDGDFNNTGAAANVNTTDFSILRSVINKPYTFSSNAASSDLDASGTVNTVDYSIFRTLINKLPGPSGLACAGTIPCPSP